MRIATTIVTSLHYVVPVAALLLLWLWPRLESAGRTRLVTRALVVLAGLATLHYVWPHVKERRFFNGYEHLHYYIGTKYAPELGYTGLYVATLGALDELAAQGRGAPMKLERVRDLVTAAHVAPEVLRAQFPEVRSRFENERWVELRDDVAFFRERVSVGGLRRALDDKGYNASPAWTMVSGAIANAVPTSSGLIRGLPFLDVLLWITALVGIGLAFGSRAASLVLVVLGTHLVMDHSHLKAAFLRVDWIVCLLLAMVAAHRKHPALAGALVGYAAMMRVFPAVFAFGAGVMLVSALARRRGLDRSAVLFLLAFASMCAALFAASSALYGLEYWRDFVEKIHVHNQFITGWRVGFKYIFLGLAGTGGQEEFFARWAVVFYALGAAVLVLCGFVVEKLEDADALAFGFVPFFLLVAPTYYYYVALLVPVLWYAKHLPQRWAQVGLTLVLLAGLTGHVLMAIFDRGAALFIPITVFVFVQLAASVALLWHARLSTPVPRDRTLLWSSPGDRS